MVGKPYADHDSTKTVEVFLLQKNWKRPYVERKRSGGQSTNEDLQSKKSKKYQVVQKTFFQLIIRTILYSCLTLLLYYVSKRAFLQIVCSKKVAIL